jgi:spermidine/putrescine transport system ATP-binding protein
VQFLSSRKENRGVRKFRFFDKVNKKRAAVKAESPALSFYSCPTAGIKRLRRHRFYTSLKGRVRDMKELVRLEGITKAYGDHVIIPPLSLSIHDGEFLTLLGPSGCGKTTLLRMLAGLDTPTKGKIILDGQDITNLPPYKRDVNMVFQNYALFPHMTAEENIGFGLRMKGVGREEAAKRTQKLLKLIQLEDLRSRYPSQMSGGQQQRVAVARALVNNPKMLLLDEPLGALDYQLRKTLQIELKDLQEELGLTFVFVTHDQEEALTMSDRIVIMDKGEIQQDDDPNTIYHYPKTKFVAEFIGESNFFDNGKEILVLRPEKLNLCGGKDGDDSHPAPRFFGTVEDVIFYGTIDKVFIRLDGTGQEVLAYQYFDDVHRWQIDDHVGIWWYEKDEVRVER